TKSFIDEGRWDSLLNRVKKGDWVLIQFGHNDQKTEDPRRSAPANTVYKANLERFVANVKSKGANPVLITPVSRRKFDEQGQFVDQHGDYPAVVKQVAAATKTPLIDLHKQSMDWIKQQGEEASKRMFLFIPPNHFPNYKGKQEDNTHFSEYGAATVAAMVAKSLQQQPVALNAYLKQSVHQGKYAFDMPLVYVPHFAADTISIAQYGANPDGVTLNTQFIQNAIDACNAKGGGVVLVPTGLWLTGPIVLKSNVNLHLQANALLQFSASFDDYPLVAGNWEGQPNARMQSPISANNAVNIAITGKGIIDGNGDALRMVKKDKLTESQWKKKIASGGVLDEAKRIWYPSASSLAGSKVDKAGVLMNGKTLADYTAIKDFLRPNLLVLNQCKNILLEGVTFQNSAAWCLHPLMSEHITLRNLQVRNPWYAQNGDGLDLESCSYILMENCVLDVGDDGICIKSGRDEAGRQRGMPTHHGVFKNNTVYHAHGGFVIGSEMSGGAHDLFVENSTFIGTDIGLRFKTTRGRGGIVEHIYIANTTMRDIPGEAILFDMYYMAKDPVPLAGEQRELPAIEVKPVTEATPQFRKFVIDNVVCIGAEKAVFIRGLPEMPVQDLSLSNLVIQSKEGIECQEAANIRFNEVTVHTLANEPAVKLINSKNLYFNKAAFKTGFPVWYQLAGDRTYAIHIDNGSKLAAEKKIEFAFGAKQNSLVTKQ
ncbi:MAG TPA: glycosyl hydrolase family 28 protein, partial [Phnomibacter sp.]|nr:glycosyl hydrolase family 28 protein [Phnomibacter sp.]